jgi:hypothetical protein
MPPLALMLDGAYTARDYCTPAEGRSWRVVLSQSSFNARGDSDAIDERLSNLRARYLLPSNRHRNVDCASLYLDRLADAVGWSFQPSEPLNADILLN